MSDNKHIYVPKDLALLLEVKESTLRKHFQTLELHSYKFLKSDSRATPFKAKEMPYLFISAELILRSTEKRLPNRL